MGGEERPHEIHRKSGNETANRLPSSQAHEGHCSARATLHFCRPHCFGGDEGRPAEGGLSVTLHLGFVNAWRRWTEANDGKCLDADQKAAISHRLLAKILDHEPPRGESDRKGQASIA